MRKEEEQAWGRRRKGKMKERERKGKKIKGKFFNFFKP